MLDQALDALFRTARTHSSWTATPVTDEMLEQSLNIAELGPISANCSPARVVLLRTPEMRKPLGPVISTGNVEKMMSTLGVANVTCNPSFYDPSPSCSCTPTRAAGSQATLRWPRRLRCATPRRRALA